MPKKVQKRLRTLEKDEENLCPQISLSFIPSDTYPPVDKLGRAGYSQAIYKLIDQGIPDERCGVIGVEGGWGSGKSFTIEQIRHLNLKNADKRILWMPFSPWNFENTDDLISIYLNQLASFIEQQEKTLSKWKKFFLRINSTLETSGEVLASLVIAHKTLSLLLVLLLTTIISFLRWANELATLIGGVAIGLGTFKITLDYFKDIGTYLTDISDALKAYSDISRKISSSPSPQLYTLKNTISSMLANDVKSFRKIVVCIEDLDRLTPEEVRSVMQLVRGVADFPRITYLLGYDRQHVVNALSAQDNNSKEYGEGFLQKIVDAPFTLPKPSQQGQLDIFWEQWHRNASLFYDQGFEERPYWRSVFREIYFLVNHNLRDFQRISNRALIMLMLLGKRSHPADVLFCSYIQEFQPRVWEWFKINGIASLSRGKKFFSGESKDQYDWEKPKYGPLIKILEEHLHSEQLTQLIKTVVPSYTFDKGSPKLEEKYRFGDSDYMEFYLNYEVGSIAEINDLIDSIINDPSTRDENIKRIASRGAQSIFVLVRDLDDLFEKDALPHEYVEGLLISLGTHLDLVVDKPEPFSIASVRRAYWLAVKWINKMEGSRRATLLIRVVKGLLKNGAIYVPLSLVEKIGIEQDKISGLEKSKNPFDFKISDKQWEGLYKLITGEIRQWNHASPPRWFEHPHAAEMLFTWLRLEPNAAREIINTWVQDEYKFMLLLNSMITTNYRNDEAYRCISPHGLRDLMQLERDEIIQRVELIDTGSPYISEQFPEVVSLVDQLPDPLRA